MPMLLLKRPSSSAAIVALLLGAADAQVDVLLNCVDLTSGALREDVAACSCTDLVSFCSSDAGLYSSVVQGLDEACEGATSCCVGDSTNATAYNACWATSGAAFPDLSALGLGGGVPIILEPGPVVLPAGVDDCVVELMRDLASGRHDAERSATCCAANPDAPYCRYIPCVDPITFSPDPSKECDCAVLVDFSREMETLDILPAGTADAIGLGSCCTPGKMLDEVLGEGGRAHPTCDCAVMLDIVAADPSQAVQWGVDDIAPLEECCVRGEATVEDVTECLKGGHSGGGVVSGGDQGLPADAPAVLGCVDLASGNLKDLPGCACVDLVGFCSADAGSYSGFVSGIDEACGSAASCCPGESTDVAAYNSCWETGGAVFPDLSAVLPGVGGGIPIALPAGDSLSCWFGDPSSGQGSSVPVSSGIFGPSDEEYACISFCWDCAQSSSGCTDEQRESGAKLSTHTVAPVGALGTFEAAYSNFGFSSCQTDDCNKANACTGESDLEIEIGDNAQGGSLSCWVNDYPSFGQGSSVPVSSGLFGPSDEEYACTSFCWDCALSSPDDTACTEEQRESKAKLSTHGGIPVESLATDEALYANLNFFSCQTDDCNKADACTGEVVESDQEIAQPEPAQPEPAFDWPESCWVDGLGSASVSSILGQGQVGVCISYCFDCATQDEDNQGICTDEQVAAGEKLSFHSMVPKYSVESYAWGHASRGFSSCDTTDCNKANACTEPTEPVDCGEMPDLMPLYHASFSLPGADFFDLCCKPGETSLGDAVECIKSSTTLTPSCEDPNALICTCIDEFGELDPTCDCDVILDIQAADPSKALVLGVASGGLEDCCARGEGTSASEALECMSNSQDCGLILEQYSLLPAGAVDPVILAVLESCCAPGNATVGEALACMEQGMPGDDALYVPDADAVLDCIDLASGLLKDEIGCACVDLVTFCSFGASEFSTLVPGLDEACDGATSCCDGAATDAAAYNDCWEASGAVFPDLSAVLPGGGGDGIPVAPPDEGEATEGVPAASPADGAPTGPNATATVPAEEPPSPSSPAADEDPAPPAVSPPDGAPSGPNATATVPAEEPPSPPSPAADEDPVAEEVLDAANGAAVFGTFVAAFASASTMSLVWMF